MRDALTRIDLALMGMRHLWSPTTSGRTARGMPSTVDLSSVLVVQAVGEADSALTIAEVAERLGVAAATASRLCDRAVASGYLNKEPDPDNARRRALSLTPRGAEVHQESLAFRHDYLRQLTADWTSSEVEDFELLLTKFGNAVGAHPPQPRIAHCREKKHD